MIDRTVKELQKQKNSVLRQIDGLKGEAAKIADAIRVLLKLTGPVAVAAKAPKKRKMSAAGRKAIAAAQKARWAKLKKGKAAVAKPAKPAKVAKPTKKRRISAAGRAAMAAAGRARWAQVKAAQAAKQ